MTETITALRPGDLVAYRRHADAASVEIGVVKRVTGRGAYVAYGTGDTCALTPWSCLMGVDTDKAAKVGEWDNGFMPGELDWLCTGLYRKRTGEYFLHDEGGARSRAAVPDGTGGWRGGGAVQASVHLSPAAVARLARAAAETGETRSAIVERLIMGM